MLKGQHKLKFLIRLFVVIFYLFNSKLSSVNFPVNNNNKKKKKRERERERETPRRRTRRRKSLSLLFPFLFSQRGAGRRRR